MICTLLQISTMTVQWQISVSFMLDMCTVCLRLLFGSVFFRMKNVLQLLEKNYQTVCSLKGIVSISFLGTPSVKLWLPMLVYIKRAVPADDIVLLVLNQGQGWAHPSKNTAYWKLFHSRRPCLCINSFFSDILQFHCWLTWFQCYACLFVLLCCVVCVSCLEFCNVGNRWWV